MLESCNRKEFYDFYCKDFVVLSIVFTHTPTHPHNFSVIIATMLLFDDGFFDYDGRLRFGSCTITVGLLTDPQTRVGAGQCVRHPQHLVV